MHFYAFASVLLALFPLTASAQAPSPANLHATQEPLAIAGALVFVVAYMLVIFEERLNLPKSKPMIQAAAVLWVFAALVAAQQEISHQQLQNAVIHNLSEYSALFLFMLVAMLYINVLEERHVFESLKSKLVRRGWSYQQLFWATTAIAFCLSPIADNLTTAMVMGAVVLSVGRQQPRFVTLSCVGIVVAANAGGVFSPFGDLTSLMVWQAGKLALPQFLSLLLPALVTYLVPACCLALFIPKGRPDTQGRQVSTKRHGRLVCGLFLLTIIMALSFETLFGLPAYLGMMTGLSFLFTTTYFSRQTEPNQHPSQDFNMFSRLAVPEWDTLLFFFGVIHCVGALAFLGFLSEASDYMYGNWGASITHIIAGVASAVVDNIPIMFAILTMDPQMNQFQWLLITLTAGVGGSLLAVGSAAGVALMGSAAGYYSFLKHLQWSWAIALGYGAGIACHFALNGLL
ncbi:sodium:proton antiporter NhaD [Neiella marina]|uniref:Sodium:proton antiporter NhaD n=1 Tax=Neiella marina TaxID=508461 RepID=A0A8J2U8H6_9GAMM|nr:sodium:proton antiporter NhaD [Neiella marina]GGA86613.1 sodium:proton antiporter NhaD [Neiella marina]